MVSLKVPALVFAAAACTPALRPPSSATHADSVSIRRDIEFLASDRLEGRQAGTPGNDSAIYGVGVDVVGAGRHEPAVGIGTDWSDRVADGAPDVDVGIAFVDDEPGVVTAPRSGYFRDGRGCDRGAGDEREAENDREISRHD